MFKKLILLVGIVNLVLAGCASAVSSVPTPVSVPGGKVIVGYYPSWAIAHDFFVRDIPANRLTHINYAFSNVSAAGECMLGDAAADVERKFSAQESVNGKADSDKAAFYGNFNQLLELKRLYPHLQVLISIGGWTWSGNFSTAAQDAASRERFASSCIDLYLRRYKGVFDGLDIDWEYPVSGGLTPGKPEDKENFTLLLGELRRQLDALEDAERRHYLLTIAAPVGPGNIRNIELAKIAPYVDWINLMTYDFHGTWEATTNFNAPLFQPKDDPSSAALTVDAAVQAYLSAGVPADKLVLGVPFYGRGWAGVSAENNGLYQPASGAAPGTREAGSYEYKDIQQHFLATYTRYWNTEAYVPWLYNPETQIFITYDDPQSLEAKAGYARDQELAGIMIWELSQGDEALLEAIYQGLEKGGPPRPTPVPTVMLPRPFEKEIHAISGITVDGKLDDWPASPDFVLNDEAHLAYRLSPTSWSGPQDLSAKAWAGWTPEGLYFALQVVDDIHVQPYHDEKLWQGDHVELQFDTLLDKDYTDPGMNDDDYQIGISVGDFDQVPPLVYAWFNGPKVAAPVEAVQIAYTPTEDGYLIEIFVPKDVLSGISLVDGAVFGMNVSVSDADNAGQGQKAVLSTSPVRTYADPRTFGKITLVPE